MHVNGLHLLAAKCQILVFLIHFAVQEVNVEYQSKRSSARLGPLQLIWLRPGFWRAWDRQRLLATRGAAEQYKHPCLINDLGFHSNLAVGDRVD